MAFYEVQLIVTTTPIQPFTREQVGFVPGNVYLSVEVQNVRYRYGGGTPSTTDGHLLFANTSLTFRKTSEIERLKLCSTTGTAIIQATVEGK